MAQVDALGQRPENAPQHHRHLENYQDDRELSNCQVEPMKVPVDVAELDLSIRSSNCLRHAGVHLVSELIKLPSWTLLDIRNFGVTSLEDVRERLNEFGLVLADHPNAASINTSAEFVATNESNENSGSTATQFDFEAAFSTFGTIPTYVTELDLSIRSSNCLRHAGVHLVSELIKLPFWTLLDIRNFGVTSLEDVRERLNEFGLVLASDPNAAAINASAVEASRRTAEDALQASRRTAGDAALLDIQHLAAWGRANGYLNLSAVIIDAAAESVDDTFPNGPYERLQAGLTEATLSKVDEFLDIAGLEGEEASAADLEAIEILAALQTATSWSLSNGYDSLEELLQDAETSLVDCDELQDALLTISSEGLEVLGEPHVGAYSWRGRIEELIDQSGLAHRYRPIVEGRWTGHTPAILEGLSSGHRKSFKELGLELSVSTNRVRQHDAHLKDLLLSDPVIHKSALHLDFLIGDFLSLPMLNAAGFDIKSFEDKALLELASLVGGNRNAKFHLVSAWDNVWICREPQVVEGLATNEFWATAVGEIADFETVLIAVARKLLEHETSLDETEIAGQLVEAFGESALTASRVLSTNNPQEPSADEERHETSISGPLGGTIGDPVSAGQRPQRARSQTEVAADGPVHALRKRAEGIVDSDRSLHRRDTQLLLWTGSYAAKAVRVLASEGRPMGRDNLAEAVCEANSSRGALAQIQDDDRILRLKKQLYGLSEWGGTPYLGIVDHMVESINTAGGRIELWELQRDLREQRGINADSVKINASENPHFVLIGEHVRLRMTDEVLEAKPLGECPNVVRIGDRPSRSRWAWRIELTGSEWFRGSGTKIPRSFAIHLGLRPGEEGELRCGTKRVGWYWNKAIDASLSNSPGLREQVGGVEGQYALFVARGPGKIAIELLDLVDPGAPALLKLLRLVGADSDSTNPLGALAFAIGLERGSNLDSVAKQMRERNKRLRRSLEQDLFAEAFDYQG